ncbi:hypothetical protein A9K65_032845 (plasmid) [Mesorhizobium sp. WSM1497]|nr:hypothetical protein A9K65_032845 [Mesorhizobium sp. WSM1497]
MPFGLEKIHLNALRLWFWNPTPSTPAKMWSSVISETGQYLQRSQTAVAIAITILDFYRGLPMGVMISNRFTLGNGL